MDKHFSEFWRVGVIGREITKGLGSTLGGDFNFFLTETLNSRSKIF